MLNEPIVKNPTRGEQIIIRLLIGVGILCLVNFCYFFFRREYVGNPWIYGLLTSIIIYGVIRDLGMWYYYLRIYVPETPLPQRTYTVDVLTTFYPGEPYDMIVNTLRAIQEITYPHTTYLCDEGDDAYLKEVCKELGVLHVTRTNRIDAKAGNINNALKQATGEICLILDPDHIPQPGFLDYIVPHFQDPAIGFVQTVQAYYNKAETLVAKGAAQQTFHFYGPMMMTMNSYGTVNAIGANCTFRREALDSIGGHAPGLAEDMHTAMLLYNEGWKSVYVPRILAEGLVPSTITAYFKQQIKWSRGTFDLFFKVYPRIFSSLTWRQRLHYALLPLHYLAGIFYFIGFLIPILSLVLSDTPWTGDFGDFIFIFAPVLFSSFVVRFYIQKWLISDDERGFHIVGGILEILTWWVFSIGFIYTLINKKVPYLPTPKNDEDVTHANLLIPNLVVGLASLGAIIYGLSRDLTPFSLIMAGFALVNAFFMFFSVYLAFGVTNRNRVIRSRLPHLALLAGRTAKGSLLWFLDAMTLTVRKLAPVLLLGFILGMFGLLNYYDQLGFEKVEADKNTIPMAPTTKLGLFYPSDNNGLSDISLIGQLENEMEAHADIISSYIAWHPVDAPPFLQSHLTDIGRQGSIPLITWEPWVSSFPASDSSDDLRNERRGLYHIAQGDFDEYIKSVAHNIRDYGDTVYLRFAHEFDNPAYPWSATGGNTPEDFIQAWQHVHQIFREERVKNVKWVWNPWKAAAMAEYFPGKRYVDYLGLTTLNYGPSNPGRITQSFQEIYAPFRQEAHNLPVLEVVLAEFGSLGSESEKYAWMEEAMKEIYTTAPEVKAIVAFNNSFDTNIPTTDRSGLNRLDWKLTSPPLFSAEDRILLAGLEPRLSGSVGLGASYGLSPVALPDKVIRAIGYKKAGAWSEKQYIPSRKNLEIDFQQMKELGINAIRVGDPGIYAHNLMTIAPEFGLDVIYNFWIPETVDFVHDSTALKDLSASIVHQVITYRDEPALITWNIGNDVITRLGDYYLQPKLREQQTAYLRWLRELVVRIKAADISHPLILTVNALPFTESLIKDFGLDEIGIDGIGLAIGPNAQPALVRALLSAQPGRFVINEISADQLGQLPQTLDTRYTVITNWQNEWDGQKLSFDGLLDFGGRKKPAFVSLNNRWMGLTQVVPLPEVDILPTARPPYTGSNFRYHATVLQDGEWKLGQDLSLEASFEWTLIKNDEYGNPLALKRLPSGPTVDLIIPDDYQRYEVRLSLTDGTYSRSARSSLVPRVYPAGSAETLGARPQ